MRRLARWLRLAPWLPLALAACAPVAHAPPRPLPLPQLPVPQLAVPQLAVPRPPEPVRADYLRVTKSARTLEVWSRGRLIRTIGGVQLGPNPDGHKRFEGDGRTPEGRYVLDWRNPRSRYHLSLHVSYPNARDTAFARERGRDPGGMIMIHGQPNDFDGRLLGDWTDGCIALSDAEIEQLWDTVPDGAVIDILP